MRLVIISLLAAAVGCNLYYGSDESASKHHHGPDAGCCGLPDAAIFTDAGGSGSGSCHIDAGGGGFPDAAQFPDGGWTFPDAGLLPDGGYGGQPDAGLHPDGGYH